MAFFGPGGLAGRSEPGLDPQLMDALIAQFPGLESLRGQQQGPPNTLQSMGYQWQGPTLYAGQGTNSFTLSPFEGAGGASPESVTAGLASGTFGKSASQQSPFGGQALGQQGGQGSLLSLPSLQLPMAQVNAQQGSFSGDMTGGGGQGADQGGMSIGLGDVLGAGQKALDLFGGSQLGQQTATPGYAEQRAGERADYTNATGSPGGIPQSLLTPPAPLSSFLQPGFGADTTFSMGYPENFGVTSPLGAPQTLAPGTTFEMPGQGTTMMAPGGSAQAALGQPAPQGDLLGGGLSTLQGLMSLYGGTQSGDIGQLLGGTAGTLGGLSQMAPETMSQISQSLGLGQSGLGLAGSGLGGLAGGYGLYQGIQQGDPIQALMGAAGLYTGAAPIVNQFAGTALPGLSELASQAINAIMSGVSGGAGAAGGAGASAAGAGAGASAGASATLGAVAPIVAGLIAYLGNAEEMRARDSGWWNNPIKGQLYSNATYGVSQAQKALDSVLAGADMGGQDTLDLANALGIGLNNLLPYYQTAQGGRGAIRASDTVTGRKQGPTSSGEGYTGDGASPEQYTQNFTNAQTGVVNLVNELLKRGVPYEAIGQIPVTGDWTQQSLDMGDPLQDFYQRNAGKYNEEAQSLLPKLLSASRQQLGAAEADQMATQGLNPATFGYSQDAQGNWGKSQYGAYATPEMLFKGAQGSARLAPDDVTNASSLVTSMYGGPAWTALARMGAGGPDIQNLIAQNFDPWAVMRTASPEQLAGALSPVIQQRLFEETGTAVNPGTDWSSGWAQAGGPGLVAPSSPSYWEPLMQQRAAQDPVAQQLQQFTQKLGGLTQQAPQLLQGFQGALQGAPVPQMAMAGGGGGQASQQSGGGLDLERLLRELGYLR